MSTLLSTDMNLTRPSTRLHAPPGGQSSISFGDSTVPAPSAAPSNRGKQGGTTFVFGDPYSTTPPPASFNNTKETADSKSTLIGNFNFKF